MDSLRRCPVRRSRGSEASQRSTRSRGCSTGRALSSVSTNPGAGRAHGLIRSVIVAELDHFKEINDRFGHSAGDAVLKEGAYILRKHIRDFELVYRLGGEEFLVVLPNADGTSGAPVAERPRTQIQDAQPAGHQVTGSLGVATGTGASLDFNSVMAAADDALYRAKRSGRNAVVVAGSAHEETKVVASVR